MKRIIINPIGVGLGFNFNPVTVSDAVRKLASFLGLPVKPNSIETLANATY